MKSLKKMQIKQLELKQFRNVEDVSLDFPENITVFVGNNGQGKTNIIESIVFLGSGRSFRVNDDKILIQNGKEFAKAEAVMDSGHLLKIVVSEQGKYLQVNHSPLKKLSDFIGYCNVILFNPDDLNFFTDAPKIRRRSVDFELGKLSKDYIGILSRYTQVLTQRNALLKSRNIDFSLLEILDSQLIEYQIPIIKQRNAFIARLEPVVERFYQAMSQTSTRVNFEYRSPVSVDSSILANLTKRMQEMHQRDLDIRATQVGIHRDDYVFKMDGVPVINTASQGQKRMLMIAFKLALVSLVYELQGAYPILCLDDLFSELDESRRKMVLKMIPDAVQVFITTTDMQFIQTERNLNVFHVNKGIIHKEVI
ncbi:DNA replication/repair protein RecF [Erysipelothrix aquatica]|uniref:DNA replication/repair protein RecF n=1 Tax=Erysipelothrix aquatica TaxID=2683714 RepID=UPI001F352ADD|nr:DNA replication/repair protein RecF [Erysipelothrix aquatica]